MNLENFLYILKKNKLILLVIISGIALRVLLNNIVYSKDAESFVFWGYYLKSNSITSLYTNLPGDFTPLPPFYYYITRALAFADQFINPAKNVWITYLVFKIPPVFVEIIVTVFIYKTVKKLSNFKNAVICAAFYFLNPAIIYNTAVFGQIDSFISGLSFLAVIFIAKHKYLLGLLIYCLAFLSKLQSLAILPLVAILTIKGNKITKLVTFIPILTLLCLLPFLIMISEKGIVWVITYFKELPNWYPYTSIYTYNLWAPTGFIVLDSERFLGLIPYRYLGQLFYWGVASAIIVPLIKVKKPKIILLFFAAFLLYFDFAFFATRIHTRYVLYSLPFLASIFYLFPKKAFVFIILVCINLILPMQYDIASEIATILNYKPTVILFTTLMAITFISFYTSYRKMLYEK